MNNDAYLGVCKKCDEVIKICPKCSLVILEDIELAYLAGFFDGEGSVYIRRAKPKGKNKRNRNTTHVLCATVTNTVPGVIKILFNAFGGNIHQTPSKQGYKTRWTWSVQAKKADRFLRLVSPYLIVKKDEAELALSFRDKFFSKKHGRVDITEKEFDEREQHRIKLQELKRIDYGVPS